MRGDDPGEGGDRPGATRRCCDAPGIEVPTDRCFGVTRQDPLDNLPDHCGFIGTDRAPVDLVTERAGPATGPLPRLGQLLVLTAEATGLVVALLAAHRPEDTGMELAVMSA